MKTDAVQEKSINFSNEDFLALASIAQKEFGLELSESKKPLVFSRISKRLKARKISDIQSYLKVLENPTEETEKTALVSALTTNVTQFLREKHHFDTLREDSLKPNMEALRSGERYRIWSAGCSTGQEPYSIAATILEAIPEARNFDVKILATDIDPEVVQKAKQGIYWHDDAVELQKGVLERISADASSGSRVIKDSVKSMISFAELNLIHDWPFKGMFDAIFCRNVAIYFNKETQQRLWSRFSERLTKDGILFIGHSERISGPAMEKLSPIGTTTYRNS